MSTSQNTKGCQQTPEARGLGQFFFSQPSKEPARSLTSSLQNNAFLLLKPLCYSSPSKLIRREEQDESVQTSQ